MGPQSFSGGKLPTGQGLVLGTHDGVSLRDIGFSFLCGTGIYLDLSTLWRGAFPIIAAVPEATIMATKDLTSSGGISQGSFLEETLKPVQKRQKRTIDGRRGRDMLMIAQFLIGPK